MPVTLCFKGKDGKNVYRVALNISFKYLEKGSRRTLTLPAILCKPEGDGELRRVPGPGSTNCTDRHKLVHRFIAGEREVI